MDPLLVSVRSGARDSMPGMLETILDLGLNDESVPGLAARTGNERFAWDSYRRFVQMFGNVVRDIPGERYEEILAAARRRAGAREDRDLQVDHLREVTRLFRALYEAHTGDPFPQDPQEQLRLAIRAVFDSWMGDRAVAYRRINHIPDDWGTAVNVQQMVFGNRGADSATGVAFSRDEITGAPMPSGDFLLDAQGEDVVSGVRTPRPLHELAAELPAAHAELLRILRTLETHYGDMQDVEFTVERGRFYMLQTRSAKRPAQAAVRFAVDAVDEGLLTRELALATIDAGALDALLHPSFDPRGALRGARATASPPRRAPPRARSSSPRRRPSTRPHRAATSSWCARSRKPTTSPASTPLGASSPPKAARPRTRPSSPAVWGAPRWSAQASWTSMCARVRCARATSSSPPASGSPSTAAPAWSRSTTCRSWSRAAASASSACCAGPTTSGASACGPTPTPPPTRRRRSRTAPRASACAGPSTCSWRPTAFPRCAR